MRVCVETAPAMLKERERESAMDERKRETERESFRNDTPRDPAAILDGGGAGKSE
jgi:hypothetical protein